jgi:hypothetical protein
MDIIVNKFKDYQTSHPNLSNCWLAYLELKKEHYGPGLAAQCRTVLAAIENGYADLSQRAILLLMLYQQTAIYRD